MSTETAQPKLDISDIDAAVKVIDHAANEGAFKGWEIIREVMNVRNRLAAFVQAAQTPAPSDEQPTA